MQPNQQIIPNPNSLMNTKKFKLSGALPTRDELYEPQENTNNLLMKKEVIKTPAWSHPNSLMNTEKIDIDLIKRDDV